MPHLPQSSVPQVMLPHGVGTHVLETSRRITANVFLETAFAAMISIASDGHCRKPSLAEVTRFVRSQRSHGVRNFGLAIVLHPTCQQLIANGIDVFLEVVTSPSMISTSGLMEHFLAEWQLPT